MLLIIIITEIENVTMKNQRNNAATELAQTLMTPLILMLVHHRGIAMTLN